MQLRNRNQYSAYTELIQIKDKSKERIKSMKFNLYEINIPNNIYYQYETPKQITSIVVNQIKAHNPLSYTIYEKNEPKIISHLEIQTQYNILNHEEEIIINKIKDDYKINFNEHNRIIQHLFYQSVNKRLKENYQVIGRNFIDKSVNVIKTDIQSYEKPLRSIINNIKLYGGFSFGLKTFGNNIYLQISPKSNLYFDCDINQLIRDNILSPNEIQSLFQNVVLPINRAAKLYKIRKITASDSIKEYPYNSKSFIDCAKYWYPHLRFLEPKAPLICTRLYSFYSNPWYFSSEHVRPSLTFNELSLLDPSTYRKVLTSSKYHSSNRAANIIEYLDQEIFYYLDEILELESKLLECSSINTHIHPDSYASLHQDSTSILKHPSVEFQNKTTGDVIEISRDPPYHAAVSDIKNHKNITCFSSPKKLELKVFSDFRLLEMAFSHMEALSNYFRREFDIELFYDEILPVSDLANSYDNFSDLKADDLDCVLVFGPRFVHGNLKKSKQVYTVPETAILNQGIPVQYVADYNTRQSPIGQSLYKKTKNNDALFGLAINILSKIGYKIMGFSNETKYYFIPNSVVIGYNVIRIYKDITLDENAKDSLLEQVRKTTPIVAPIVIMSDDGNDLIMQDVYEIPDDVSLFKEGRGEEIINNIPDFFDTIIIHKDGPFFKEELLDLKNIEIKNKRIIPVSIITSSSPRLFTTHFTTKAPLPGTVMKLSDEDFLMATPLVYGGYDPSTRGWPNSLLIKIHDLDKKINLETKVKILYQIFALTRIHQASQNPTRRPMSIHYSNMMGEFLRKVGDPRPKYFKYFKSKRNKHGLIPKIFL